MDKDVRSAIERATQKARRILEEDYAEQLDGIFDVRADGHVPEKGGAHLTGHQHILRDKIVAAIEHKRSVGMKPAEAVADYIRDAAFTTLNRFVALKMLEARGLVLECISHGDGSSGFAEFCGLAPSVKTADDAGYRLYIESIFDELSTEVKVLFDRRDAASVLWPKKATFDELLAVLNADDLKGVWSEDETIGWVYQFFNSRAEINQARYDEKGKPKPPQNARELAIRNQFFTPLYVIKFLCDNTLGRLWYEMRKGDTKLIAFCANMVRQPKETFATHDGEACLDVLPEETEQRALWWRPIKIGHRTKKDPRSLRCFDPACGSGHFLLQFFDILLIIYPEAWADLSSPCFEGTNRTLREDYPTIEQLETALPGLILAHNLHGIDIDRRCAQIAQLALWMRAQRAFAELGIPRAQRPLIRRANIVIAEPMPGDRALIDEFAESIRPPIIGSLFKDIVSEMRLAGEMGPLLPIERSLSISIERARKAFVEYRRQSEQGHLPGLALERRQEELDLSGIDNERFFEEAELQIIDSLQRYVTGAVNGVSTRRRLFADDAEEGIAFVELMRRKFDVAVMNPPFGLPSANTKSIITRLYNGFHNDIYASFIARMVELVPDGFVGCISSRSFITGRRLENARRRIYIPSMSILWDLGLGVMDNAEVESAAYILARHPSQTLLVLDDRHKRERIFSTDTLMCIKRNVFERMPNARLMYSVDAVIAHLLQSAIPFEPTGGTAREGPKTFDDERFLRLQWEVDPASINNNWIRFSNGGANAPFFGLSPLVISQKHDGRELDAINVALNGSTAQVRQASEYWRRPGATYSKRASKFAARALPSGFIFSGQGPGILFNDVTDAAYLLVFLNSTLVEYLVGIQSNKQKYYTGVLKALPWREPTQKTREQCNDLIARLYEYWMQISSRDETSPHFVGPYGLSESDNALNAIKAEYHKNLEDATNEATKLINGIFDVSRERLVVPIESGADDEDDIEADGDDVDPERNDNAPVNDPSEFARLISWCFGCAIGRFDVIARDRTVMPRVGWQDPFEPLPATSPAVLKGMNSAACSEKGILVDDPFVPLDIARQMTLSMETIGAAWSEDIRKWVAHDYFDLHLSMYSSMRRVAPIYWQIGTPSLTYSIWIYFHTSTKDTLLRIQNDCVTPRLAHEQRQLEILRAEPNSETAAHLKAIEIQENRAEELRVLLEEVQRVSPLFDPQHDDGVLVNAAPLWRLFPQSRVWQRKVKATWGALCGGDHDWSSLAMRLWPERVVPKCAKDRSIAIAHDLEDVFWFEDEDGKWKPRKKLQKSVDDLVSERTSTAVKAALKSLLGAPEPATGAKRSRKSKAA